MSKRAAQEEAIVDVQTMEALLQDVQSLVLEECYGARSLCDVSWLENATQDLNECHIRSCDSVECLVPCGSSSLYFLRNIEELWLYRLGNLEVLFEELGRGENGVPSSSTPPPAVAVAVAVAITEGAFSCLKVLHLSYCHKIKILFHHSFLPDLRNLQKIRVDKCEALQEIITETISEGGTRTIVEYALPNLTTLKLRHLPKLKSICAQTISCPSIRKISVLDCPRLKRMPLSKLPSSFQSIGTVER